MIDRRITEIIHKKNNKSTAIFPSFYPYIHYQSFLPILPDWRSNVLDNAENAASHFKPRSKETPSPSPFPPKIYNAILDISTIRITAKNPLKNLIRVFAFGFLTDYHPYYGIQQRFQKLRSIARGYSRHGGRESVSKLACVTGRPTRDIGNPRWGFPVHRGKRGEQRCPPPLSGARFVHGGRGICIQSATLRWYLNHGDGRDEWRCLFFPSLLRVSVPVDTLCTRYSKKYNAWMDLSWKRRR